jgi:general secretion pathway protein C
MIQRAWGRRAILAAYVMVLAFVLAHSVNAYVSYSLTASIDSPLPVIVSHNAPAELRDAKVLAESILVARLFPVPPGADTLSGSGQPAPPPPPPLDVARKVRLLGTVVNSHNGGLAILEDSSSKAQTLYHLNDAVSSIGTIAQIEKDKVLFRQGGQEEWLDLAIGKLQTGFDYQMSVSQIPASAPSRAKKTVERQTLVDTANETARLFYHGQPTAWLVNGRSQGVRLDGVNFFGIYGKLGLESGDIVKRINGVELRDPTRLPSFFQQLKDEQTITLDIVRNNSPKTLALEIR